MLANEAQAQVWAHRKGARCVGRGHIQRATNLAGSSSTSGHPADGRVVGSLQGQSFTPTVIGMLHKGEFSPLVRGRHTYYLN